MTDRFVKISILSLAAFFVNPVIGFTDGLVSRQEMQSYLEDNHIASRYNSLDGLKEEVTILLDENKKLQDRYSVIRQERDSLKNLVNQYKQRVIESQRHFLSVEDSYQDLEGSLSDFTIETDEFGSNNDVGGEGATLKLLKLKLADLQYTKKDLEMEFKLTNYLKTKTQKSLAGYKKELDLIVQKEEMIKGQVLAMQDKISFLPQKISVLERENEKLQEQIEKVKIRNSFKEREVALKKDKKKLALRSSEYGFSDKEKVKEQLLVSVNQLQSEYDQLQERLEKSMSSQVEKKKIIQNVIELDKENQALRNKILNLKEKIDNYQYF